MATGELYATKTRINPALYEPPGSKLAIRCLF